MFRTHNDRYTELWGKYKGKEITPPLFVSVQGTERSMRSDISGTITARVGNGTCGVLVESEFASPTDKVIQIGNACKTATRDNPNQGRIYEKNGLAPCLNAMGGGNRQPFIIEEPQMLRMERTEEEKLRRHLYGDVGVKFSKSKEWRPRKDGISNTVTTIQKDNMLMEPTKEEQTLLMVRDMVKGKRDGSATAVLEADGTIRGCYNVGTHDSSISEMVIQHEKNAGLIVTTAHAPKVYGSSTSFRIRKLTPRECFRLMDVCEEDIDKIQAAGISKTQQYKMAGNSIVVSVLYEIFKAMFVEPVRETRPIQLELF